ncbi:sensor domain-containing diguanylate cyclase [Marinomonas hwangdonensis]|uniref:diguanylate cyclase n=1 Tax=Marinomonas hwangdonensis TaxID=1053647 RepID=A0A3M8Q812_9GAMM|nr:sensor domain-containing diguanylate cyclase [Marinomonas hwangdonensis]RNF51414.1 sensor domain-containing diguanylate cyclase [Marinomonas hwangdonensis]
MFVRFLRPNNLSQKMMRVIFSIYMVVTLVITSVQFLSEYLKTQAVIVGELQQLEVTVRGPISTSLWQYDQNQLDVITDGLVQMPIIEGVEVFDKNAQNIISKTFDVDSSVPLSIFDSKLELNRTLNGERIPLGTLVLYSSSGVVLDRVWFGFALIAFTAFIKLTILFWLFIWAFDRYLATPLKELMSQVNEVQLSQGISKRIHLSNTENNELSQLQEHMNSMLAAMSSDRKRLIEDEQAKRSWLEDAVAKRTEDLQALNKKLKYLATRDSLTNILNRGSFFDAAQQRLALSQRQESTVSFILMDLDYFKRINDSYGHFVGDKVLIHFTQTLQGFLRKTDLLGRVGGEEFAILLFDTKLDDASQLAEKICQAISHSALEVEGNTISYTVSLGVESSELSDTSIDELFKRADLKLYGAKDKGRDRVES